ncbi:hypothetical protein, partial [Nocardia brevicatena]|uniref:hypothetical protein n=1 Tax=Nocardia brevicatena TaxID=37327 RepID=UPI001C3F1605
DPWICGGYGSSRPHWWSSCCSCCCDPPAGPGGLTGGSRVAVDIHALVQNPHHIDHAVVGDSVVQGV